jgi:ubiquinone biosynthesis protein
MSRCGYTLPLGRAFVRGRLILVSSIQLARASTGAVGSLYAGRRRYIRAVRTVVDIVALYGRHGLAVRRARGAELEHVHQQAAEAITQLCRRNGAIWVKAAQFFSCRPDVLPPAYIVALQALQNDADGVPFSHIVPVLERAWGSRWRDHFLSFDEQPAATASIAQVHRAVLRDGREVAIKIRLPRVIELFDQDAKVFRLLSLLAAPLFRELDFVQITEQLLEMTSVELDFRNEAENMRRFARIPHPPRIKVAGLIEELSGAAVLVSEWQHGHRLRDYLDQHPDQAADLLTLLFTSYLQQVTRVGIYQADPHPGNFIVNDQGEISILDFGTLGRLTPDEVRNYSRLLYGLMGFEGDVDIGQLFVDAGFVGGNPDTLRDLALYVLSDRMKRNDFGMAMSDLLDKFREHRVRIPDSYIGIARVLITLGGFLMTYNVPFDWTPPERRKQI